MYTITMHTIRHNNKRCVRFSIQFLLIINTVRTLPYFNNTFAFERKFDLYPTSTHSSTWLKWTLTTNPLELLSLPSQTSLQNWRNTVLILTTVPREAIAQLCDKQPPFYYYYGVHQIGLKESRITWNLNIFFTINWTITQLQGEDCRQ